MPMQLTIDPKIFEQHRDLKIGVIIIKGLNNSKRVSAVESLLRGICAQRAREFVDKDVYENPMIGHFCQAYGRFGINPKKYPPSVVALLKRVKSGKEIPHVNVLVDLYNYFSLKYLLPIGGEDMDWLCGDLKLAFTKGGEPFRPIGEVEVQHAAEGEVAYLDDGGITCRYWNYRECERTKFTTKTVNAVLLIEDLSKMHMDEFGGILRDIQNNIIKYIGGEIEPYILNEENRSVDLGIQGRKNVDDSKVPQQEKAYFMEQQALHKSEKTASPASTDKPAASKKKASTSKVSSVKNFEDKGLFKQQLKALVKNALKKSFPKLKVPDVSIEYPASEEHGDYASNIAMHLTKILKIPPREIAQKIIDAIGANDLCGKIEIAGPGFINFFLADKELKNEIEKIIKKKDSYGSSQVGKKETMIFEYSSPNIAKPLGAHHIQTTILGQSLYNIFSKLGFKCISINHIGDWGTQFGKMICAYKKWGNREQIEKNPIEELLKLYVKFHEESEQNPALEDEARKEFKDFEEGNDENRELWKWFVEVSMKDINKTYAKLGGVHFDFMQGESFYEDKMADILADGKKKKVFVQGEEGAFVINFENPDIPTVPIQKKDGTTLYLTRDITTLKYRIDHFHPTKIIYVVDYAQTLHFKQLFEAAKRLGWYHDEAEHVWFGRMQMKDANMSTRKGNIIMLDEVLDEAVKRAGKILEEKSPETHGKEKIAEIVGVGAVKYNVLSQNRTTDITFEWDKILALDGNSAPYLQYSYARAKSILRKGISEKSLSAALTTSSSSRLRFAAAPTAGGEFSGVSPDDVRYSSDPAPFDHTASLARFLPKFPEYIAMAAKEYKPNIIANYLYFLGQKFNAFYNTIPVLKENDPERKKQLLILVEATAQVLKNGLNLLGVEVVEEM